MSTSTTASGVVYRRSTTARKPRPVSIAGTGMTQDSKHFVLLISIARFDRDFDFSSRRKQATEEGPAAVAPEQRGSQDTTSVSVQFDDVEHNIDQIDVRH